MERKVRPEIPKEKIIPVKNTKKIDFDLPFKFIYMDWWFNLATLIPVILVHIITYAVGLLVGLKVKGRENLKTLKKQGCIVISNHCHYFDTVFANVLISPMIMHTSVAQRNFEVPIVRWILRIVRCFPIPARKGGLNMIKKPVGEALKRKHHIMVLPEGELVLLSQTIQRFHMGAFILSYWHQAPIVPFVYVIKPHKFRWDFMNKHLGPNWKIRMTLVVGKPIFPPKLREDDELPMEELRDMAEIAASWMEETIARHHQESPVTDPEPSTTTS